MNQRPESTQFRHDDGASPAPGDLLLGISTSGNSPNLVRAFHAARRQGLTCLALLGGDGGDLAALADHALIIPAADTQRIQEAQLLVLHLLCELIELRLPGLHAAKRAHTNYALHGSGAHANTHPPARQNGRTLTLSETGD